MARLDIDFILMDESVVDYGFRCLMSGAQLDEFKKNPVLLFMHLRSEQTYYEMPKEDVIAPIGKWYDIRIEGGKLLAKPEFDDDDPLAVKIEKKVIKGYLNAASIWLDPIAWSEDPNLMLPGQCGPTFTAWGVRESSVVDIPNCRGAIAIRNKLSGKKMLLSGRDTAGLPEVLEYIKSLSTTTKTPSDMELKLLALKLGLSENATAAEVQLALEAKLSAANSNATAQAEITRLKVENDAYKLAADGQKAETLIASAIVDKKIAEGEKADWLKLAAQDFDTTKKLLDAKKAYTPIEGTLNTGDPGANKVELEELMKLSGRQLYLDGKLERLKAISVEHFKLKYKEAFNTDYKEVTK